MEWGEVSHKLVAAAIFAAAPIVDSNRPLRATIPDSENSTAQKMLSVINCIPIYISYLSMTSR